VLKSAKTRIWGAVAVVYTDAEWQGTEQMEGEVGREGFKELPHGIVGAGKS
jgi:hypothetical protein